MDVGSSYDPNRVADLILRSSDNVDFYVIGPLLRIVSPFFVDMLDLAGQGPAVEQNEKKDGLFVIDVQEDSETLRLLLDLLYPYAKDPPLTDVELFWKVGMATQKYMMDVIRDKLKGLVFASDLGSASSHRIYAVAVHLGWNDILVEAANRTLETPLADLTYGDELARITGSDYLRFLDHRFRCEGHNSTASRLEPFSAASRPADIPNSDTNTSIPNPFNLCTKSDLILRSSDFVDFFVPELSIRLVSQDFDAAFPVETRENKDGKVIIQLAEDSKTLHHLLSIVYHLIGEPDIRDFQLYKGVVEAVRNYKMYSIEKRLQKQALASPAIWEEPLPTYALATALRWDDVARSAALNTFLTPLEEIAYIEELSRITGEDLHRLLQFRFRCGDAIVDFLQTKPGVLQYGPGEWHEFWSPVSNSASYRRYNLKSISWEEIYNKIRACPRASTITGIYTSQLEDIESKAGHLTYKGGQTAVHQILGSWVDLENQVEKIPLMP